MRSIAIVEGASLAVIGTECAAPTLSSEGAITLTNTVSAIQPTMIGIANNRIARAIGGRGAASSGALWRLVMLTSPSRRFARDRTRPTPDPAQHPLRGYGR